MAALVQKKSAVGSSGNGSVTFDATPTQNNLLVAMIFCANATTITMSSGGWTALTSVATGSGGSARAFRMFYKIAGAGESTTVSTTNGNNSWVLTVAEYSGIDTTTPKNVENAQSNASGNAQTTPTVTPTGSGDILIVCAGGARVNSNFVDAQINGSATGVTDEEDNASAGGGGATLDFYDKLVTGFSGAYQGSTSVGTAAVGAGGIAIFNQVAATSIFPDKWHPLSNNPQPEQIGLVSY